MDKYTFFVRLDTPGSLGFHVVDKAQKPASGLEGTTLCGKPFKTDGALMYWDTSRLKEHHPRPACGACIRLIRARMSDPTDWD